MHVLWKDPAMDGKGRKGKERRGKDMNYLYDNDSVYQTFGNAKIFPT